MKASELTDILYERSTDLAGGTKGEVTERTIIPTFVPAPNIKALDVTDLSDEERAQLAEMYAEYTEYYKQAAKTLFTFEDWIAHSRGEENPPEIKWRTFKQANIQVR